MTLRLNGSTSGYTEIDAPAVAGSNIIQLPAGNGTAYQVIRNGATAGSLEFTDKIVSGTAQASTSGTSIDFTGIPSWVKRITVMFNGVSTNGTSNPLIQIGSGSVSTSGYQSGARDTTSVTAGGGVNYTTGFGMPSNAAINVLYGHSMLTLISSNTWVNSHSIYALIGSTYYTLVGAGVSPALSGTLDRVRITTVNGTDTFDAGSINILYE
jgi:hypothetical protein